MTRPLDYLDARLARVVFVPHREVAVLLFRHGVVFVQYVDPVSGPRLIRFDARQPDVVRLRQWLSPAVET